MKFVKFGFLFLTLSFLAVSCGDETCDTLSEAVPGTWTVDLLGTGSVELKENGDVVDNGNLIFEAALDNASKTWTIDGSTLTFNATENGQTTFYEFVVSSFDCDTITTTNGGNTFVFRKQ